MYHLYHRIPPNMRGDVLYPLNELRNVYPDAYAEAVKKYEGREHLLERKVPILNCLWNDVLHLSAVDPLEIKAELEKNGQEMRSKCFCQIDSYALEPGNTVVYSYRHFSPDKEPIDEDFAPYDPDNLKELSVFPEETKAYYAEMIRKDAAPLLWHRIPHILYKGRIHISNLKVLEL